jgi:hypothetical protein
VLNRIKLSPNERIVESVWFIRPRKEILAKMPKFLAEGFEIN